MAHSRTKNGLQHTARTRGGQRSKQGSAWKPAPVVRLPHTVVQPQAVVVLHVNALVTCAAVARLRQPVEHAMTTDGKIGYGTTEQTAQPSFCCTWLTHIAGSSSSTRGSPPGPAIRSTMTSSSASRRRRPLRPHTHLSLWLPQIGITWVHGGRAKRCHRDGGNGYGVRLRARNLSASRQQPTRDREAYPCEWCPHVCLRAEVWQVDGAEE